MLRMEKVYLKIGHKSKSLKNRALSMGFFRQEYWSELPCPPPGDLPAPGIEPGSLVSPALAGRFFTTAPPGQAPVILDNVC